MRVIEPSQFQRPLRKKRPIRGLIIFIAIVLVASYTVAAYARPLPNVKSTMVALSAGSLEAPKLAWPSSAQAALGAVGYGVLAEAGAQTTAPIASVAKVMTALAVLKQKPLKLGEQGPLITLDEQDTQSYNDYAAQGGSVIPVNYGEQISQYQALQALLLPSANNMAFSLSRWAFGSEANYLTYANRLAASLHLTQTHLADASGFSDATTSTPRDLVILAEEALQNPVLAEIFKQATASVPVAGEIANTNWLLGQTGIDGIKTGNTTEAGGCFLFSSTQSYPNGQKVTLIGAVLGGPNLNSAMQSGATLLRSAINGFRVVRPLPTDKIIGRYTAPWGSTSTAVIAGEASLLVWAGKPIQLKANLSDITTATPAGANVGQLSIVSGSTTKSLPVSLGRRLTAPSVWWRLTHFFSN